MWNLTLPVFLLHCNERLGRPASADLTVSLNRYETLLFDYMQSEPDERRHWERKVKEASTAGPSPVRVLNAELWDYFCERSEHVPALRRVAQHEGLARLSMVNLAEHLLILWGEPGGPRRRTLSREEAPYWPPDER